MSINNINQIVAARVRAVMAAQKLTTAAVAESLGISRYALSSRLSGRVSFSLTDIDRFADLAGYEPSSFTSAQFCLLPIGKAA